MKKIKLFHTVAMAAFLAAVTSCEHKEKISLLPMQRC